MTLYETSLLENTHKLDNENVEPAYRNSPVVVCLPYSRVRLVAENSQLKGTLNT